MIGPSFVEILVILTLALVVLGPKRLPEIARSIGRSLREVQKVRNEVQGLWTGVENAVQDSIVPKGGEDERGRKQESEQSDASEGSSKESETAEAGDDLEDRGRDGGGEGDGDS